MMRCPLTSPSQCHFLRSRGCGGSWPKCSGSPRLTIKLSLDVVSISPKQMRMWHRACSPPLVAIHSEPVDPADKLEHRTPRDRREGLDLLRVYHYGEVESARSPCPKC